MASTTNTKATTKTTATTIVTAACGDDFKIFVSRIPAQFDEESVRRLLDGALQKIVAATKEENGTAVATSAAVVSVQLAYEKEEETVPVKKAPSSDDRYANRPSKKAKSITTAVASENGDGAVAVVASTPQSTTKHKGYGFVTLSTKELVDYAIATVRTVRGGAKPTSTRLHTLYIGPVRTDEEKAGTKSKHQDTNNNSNINGSTICFLWTAGRCPYGDQCKFEHSGPGGTSTGTSKEGMAESTLAATKKKKCRDYRKGKCRLDADTCPFSHDFVVPAQTNNDKAPKSNADKDCIDWKTKGKCRKLAKNLPCPYKHDPDKQKKRKADTNNSSGGSNDEPVGHETSLIEPGSDHANQGRPRKVKQPLTVRVSGLNYETTAASIRKLFEGCGRIVDLQIPTFADSGRGKGYCGITYTSPQAVATAVETLNGTELDGRWISVQAGKMMLDEWERHHTQR